MNELDLMRAELADVKSRLTAVEAAMPKRGRPAGTVVAGGGTAMDKLVAWFRATANVPVTVWEAATGSGAPLAGASQILRKHKGVLFRKARPSDPDDNRVLWSLIDPNAAPPAKVVRKALPKPDPAESPERKRLDKVIAFLESRDNRAATIRTIAAAVGEKQQAISLVVSLRFAGRFVRSRMAGEDGLPDGSLPWVYRLRTEADDPAADKPKGVDE